ncbi:hypothetical protein [Nostoc sp.]|uniref:hypothetical protein n=1 Tax=Nostoc sp. TaxID=1180 RepID=UPI002FFA74CF
MTFYFNGQPPTIYESNVSPIDIQTGEAPNDRTENYNSEGYQITFNSPQAAFGAISATVVDYKITYLDRGIFDSDTAYYIKLISCGDKEFPPDVGGKPGIKMTSQNVIINNAVKCSIKNNDNSRCEIKILSNGATIFRAEGECPVHFTVACARCPEGTCECHSDSYPGYCCNDCEATSGKIEAISNQLRSKNAR